MMASLKSGLTKIGSSIVAACGVVVLAVAMVAAVVYRWATRPTREIPETEFTNETVSTEL